MDAVVQRLLPKLNLIQLKGIGRLLWLDCFEHIDISSVFKDGGEYKRRSFRFVLALEDQIQDLKVETTIGASGSSFYAHFNVNNSGYMG